MQELPFYRVALTISYNKNICQEEEENNNPNASYLEKLTVVELKERNVPILRKINSCIIKRKKCTQYGIKYMHVLKKSEIIQKIRGTSKIKNILQTFMIKSKYKTRKKRRRNKTNHIQRSNATTK